MFSGYMLTKFTSKWDKTEEVQVENKSSLEQKLCDKDKQGYFIMLLTNLASSCTNSKQNNRHPL